jgi:Putative transposase/Transposase zinc-binding domain
MSQPPPAFAGAGYCPKCQGAAAKDWLAAREADLLPVGYFHVVFTLPAEIAPIAYQNKAVVYDLLFRTAAETLLTIAADPKHLGARIGATAVLHSWGSAMTHHPHVHMIVPGGGISLDRTRWVRSRPSKRETRIELKCSQRTSSTLLDQGRAAS